MAVLGEISFTLGPYQGLVERAVTEMKDQRVISRIWERDHTLWAPEPTEITNRLGWLQGPEAMADGSARFFSFADSLRREGYRCAVLLGMGGSALAPAVFRKVFGVREGWLDLVVLDTTVPGAIAALAEKLDPERTIFVVSTKSGTTVETISLFKFFYNWMADALGGEEVGRHFVAITDPGSPLIDIGGRYRFRVGFLNAAGMGGRYGAISSLGLVPAALIGVDLGELVARSRGMARRLSPKEGGEPALLLGALLGELAKEGRDKVTLILSPQIVSFGDWLEQLLAESTGKGGKGILPVVGEDIGGADAYGADRLFVQISLEGDAGLDEALKPMAEAGHPVVRIVLRDPYDIGGEIFLWEMAVAIACYRLGVNPFDQPDVEQAKAYARKAMIRGQGQGARGEVPSLRRDGIEVYGVAKGGTPGEALKAFLAEAREGNYVALQAFLAPSPQIDAALHNLRCMIRDRLKVATTLGYGPRYLHSTGQLHKGDGGKGLFVQFTADDLHDLPIPDEVGGSKSSLTFGMLKSAQALGDRQALTERGRKVISFHLGKDPLRGLKALAAAIAK